jgi:hypothetical protein
MSNLRGANQAGRPLLTPPLLELDVERTKELGVTFAPVASNDDADAMTFKVLGRKMLKPPGRKSTAWVAVSGKSVALVQWIGEVKICSQSERVMEDLISRISDPKRSIYSAYIRRNPLNAPSSVL